MRRQVVVAGRPNVGKSSLVNRILGGRIAVVEQSPGVTRDRKHFEAEWNGLSFDLVDTGGWLAKGDELDEKVSQQAAEALLQADVILLVTDVMTGVTEEDQHAAAIALRAQKPILMVVNKVDDQARENLMWEFLSLGLGDPWPVSALHGRGTGDLLDEIVNELGRQDPDFSHGPSATSGATTKSYATQTNPGDGKRETRIALIGRPNVGKSTLFNKLIGKERSIVHNMPGTTRDAIDTVMENEDGVFRFIDTAGMRRAAKTHHGTEHYSVLRALDAMDRADIALLVIDATVGATHQDQRLAERIGVGGSPSVVVLNKWDLVDKAQQDAVLHSVGDRLAFLGMAPVIKIAAISGKGVHRILPAVLSARNDYQLRVPTAMLNRALIEIQAEHAAPRARIRYAVQGASEPPTFTLFTNGKLPQTYLRYVERSLRERFGLGTTPLKLRVRSGGGR